MQPLRLPSTAVASGAFRVRACALVELRRSVPEWSVPRHRHRFGSAIGTSSVLVLAAIVPAQPRGSLRSVAMTVLLLCTGVLRLTYVELASFVCWSWIPISLFCSAAYFSQAVHEADLRLGNKCLKAIRKKAAPRNAAPNEGWVGVQTKITHTHGGST